MFSKGSVDLQERNTMPEGSKVVWNIRCGLEVGLVLRRGRELGSGSVNPGHMFGIGLFMGLRRANFECVVQCSEKRVFDS